MKKRLLLFCFFGSSLIAMAQPTPSTEQTAFTEGNLVIYRFGDASTTKSGLVPAFLDEITPAGEFVRSIPIPTEASGSNRGFMGGLFGQAREGLLSLSADGRYLTVVGVDGPRAGTAYADYPKVIGRFSGNGEINTSTALPTSNIANVGRNAVTKDGSAFYTTGGTGNVRYVPFGFNAGVSSDNLASAPIVGGTLGGFALSIFNDRLYFAEHTSGASSNLRGVIGMLGEGLPTPTSDMDPPATFSPLTLPGLEFPNQFALIDSDGDGVQDLLYVVEVPASNTNSIIRKYLYASLPGVPATWYDYGSFTHGKLKDAKGIAARQVGDNVQLFINTAPSGGKPTIVRINDLALGIMAASSYNVTQDYTDIDQVGLVTTLLYASLQYKFNETTDGSTVNFRGIAFAPTPFSITSVAKDLEKGNFTAYLPQDNRLQLALTTSVATPEARVFVRDITGRVLLNQTVRLEKGDNKVQLPAYHYQNGVYIVNVVTGKEMRTLKFMK